MWTFSSESSRSPLREFVRIVLRPAQGRHKGLWALVSSGSARTACRPQNQAVTSPLWVDTDSVGLTAHGEEPLHGSKQQRRKLTPEFKDEAIKLVIDSDRPVAEMVRDIGVNKDTLDNWSAAARHGDAANRAGASEKVSGLLREPAEPVNNYRVIAAEKANYPVTLMCRLLKVARSAFYAWTRRPPSARALRAEALGERIEVLHADSDGVYGSTRILVDLRAEGSSPRPDRRESPAGTGFDRFRATAVADHDAA